MHRPVLKTRLVEFTQSWCQHVAEPVRIVILGGLGEIGRNCLAIEQGTDVDRSILVIDCGIMFPSAELHGIDLVLPDFTY